MTHQHPDDESALPEQTRTELRAGLEASREMVRQSHELIALCGSYTPLDQREDAQSV